MKWLNMNLKQKAHSTTKREVTLTCIKHDSPPTTTCVFSVTVTQTLSQTNYTQLDVQHCFCSVLQPCVGFVKVLWSPPTFQRHAG